MLVYIFFNKKTGNTSTQAGTEIAKNQELANEFHRLITREFKKHKIYSSLRYNIWDADLEDIQSIIKYSKGAKFVRDLLILTANILRLFR